MYRVLRALVAIAGVVILSGCASPASPDFEVPVSWSGGRPDDPNSPDPQMSLTLRADGVADLENVPGGQWVRTDDGICWDDTTEFYTGVAEWRAFSERGVEVSFGDSNVIFWASPGRFGTYGWRELKMVACGDENKVWGLGLRCGSAGGEVMGACARSEDSWKE